MLCRQQSPVVALKIFVVVDVEFGINIFVYMSVTSLSVNTTL